MSHTDELVPNPHPGDIIPDRGLFSTEINTAKCPCTMACLRPKASRSTDSGCAIAIALGLMDNPSHRYS